MKKSKFLDELAANTKKWYEEFAKSEEPNKHEKTDVEVLDLKSEAKKCLDSESSAYHLKQSRTHNSDYSWLKTAFSKGTTSDKVAAGIVLVQNSPKHNLNHLSSLVSQVKVAKHNHSNMLISALRDLFLSDLLHPNFKLLKFEDQDLDLLDQYSKSFEAGDDFNLKNRPTLSRNKLLAIWYFEDQLKETYERFVSSLAIIANDTVDTNREKAVGVLNDLLMGNPEQEHKLLDILVNKIGDPSSKVASKAVFCLSKLLYEHPNMKMIVLHEVEKLLFRTNVSQRAQYFAICLLTQFLLSKEDTEIATTLINVYFGFFKACLKKGEPDSRMMSAILAGVNRAYPFADSNSVKLNDHIDAVYKVVHIGSFNVSLSALSLLFQVVGKNPDQANRFYTAFYRKLFDSQIGVSNKFAVFLNLLFRVLRNDQSVIRLHAFIKRVLQISLHLTPNSACATLYVISQVLHQKRSSKNILSHPLRTLKKDQDADSTHKPLKSAVKRIDSGKSKSTIMLSNVVLEDTPESIEETKVEPVEIKTEFQAKFYNPFERNPLRSGANLAFYSELEALSRHFHPSVSLFANNIIEGKRIEYTGDPLQDLSLIRFLDRYVFKNPKKLESKKVVKENDPLAQRAAYTPRGIKTLPVNCSAYLNETEDRIPVDELFLYQYLQKRKESRGFEENEVEDDNESVTSEDFNDMLDKLSKNKSTDNLDVAGDFKMPAKKSNENCENQDDNNSSSDDELLDDEGSGTDADEFDGDEGDENFEDLDDLDLEDIDDDLSDMDFNEDDEEDDYDIDSMSESSKKRKQNQIFGNLKKKHKGLDENTFVSAEEFAEMLENHGRTKFKHGASKSFSDRDGASCKQLDWETARNQKISGYRGTKKSAANKNFKSKKNFSNHQKKAKWKKK
ncbi:hypothetical protein QAD02_023228 [Eretmocerus hayati]|uniref:Uncharacterized protein n=1 Tax=Eretmocerus hayati TaxID=131215 RepID=A0ACC2PVW7_9HYME|nr:hypothetical protein QAD02_023228 [Eretmocerus hayati]